MHPTRIHFRYILMHSSKSRQLQGGQVLVVGLLEQTLSVMPDWKRDLFRFCAQAILSRFNILIKPRYRQLFISDGPRKIRITLVGIFLIFFIASPYVVTLYIILSLYPVITGK